MYYGSGTVDSISSGQNIYATAWRMADSDTFCVK